MDLFLKDIKDVNNENRQYAQKRKIVALLNKSVEPLTIPDICKKVKLSVPTGTRLINELIEKNIIIESGKKETDNGRRPSSYKTDSNYAFCVGVVVQLKSVYVSIFNLAMDEIFRNEDQSFILENSPESLERVIQFITDTISQSGVDTSHILGVGVGITGRVNTRTGNSYNYFNFLDNSLTSYLSDRLSLSVYIDNDTHVLGLAEQVFGYARDVKNALVVNLSRGLGMALITNGELVIGEQGFAGEFGHMQLGESDKLCLCGKRGCLGTEVSGYALEQNFQEQVHAGESSLLLNVKELDSVHYEDIIRAAWNGDALSISLVHGMGFKIGKALGNMINLLNPGVIIIGGNFASAREVLIDSIKSGMTHTALSLPLRNCELIFSSIGDAAVRGAGAIVLRRMQLI